MMYPRALIKSNKDPMSGWLEVERQCEEKTRLVIMDREKKLK